MIRTFRHKGLADLWKAGGTGRINAKMHRQILRRLNMLNVVDSPQGMNVIGFDFHALRGFEPTRYTVHVNGPWCLTFEFHEGDAYNIDFEQYH